MVKVEHKLPNDILEKYTALADSTNVKHGLYQMLYKKKIAVASGRYNRNKRVGVWLFYNPQGKLTQQYDFTANKLLFEGPEGEESYIRYVADSEIKKTDTTTKPIKAGGQFYGYMQYFKYFRTPPGVGIEDYGYINAVIELLVSPYGRLAEFKIRVTSPVADYNQVADVNLDLLPEQDKIFIPATLNSQSIACRIFITCRITGKTSLEFKQTRRL